MFRATSAPHRTLPCVILASHCYYMSSFLTLSIQRPDSLYHAQLSSFFFFFFSSRRRHTRYWRDWSSDVCSSDLRLPKPLVRPTARRPTSPPTTSTCAPTRSSSRRRSRSPKRSDASSKQSSGDRKSVV